MIIKKIRMSKLKVRILLNSFGTLKRNIALFSFSRQTNHENKICSFSENDEKNWFTKLVIQSKTQTNKKQNVFEKMNQNEKRNYILDYIVLNRLSDDIEFEESELILFDEIQSIGLIKKVINKIVKKRLKKLEKLENKALKKQEINTETNESNSFLGIVNEKIISKAQRHKILTSIMTNSPSIVIDCRFAKMYEKNPFDLSLFNKQLTGTIGSNKEFAEPFQIHFCNYKNDSVYHNKFGKIFLSPENNLINITNKSYIELFPKEKLVYLTKDAQKTMIKFDPEKVYIIGSLLLKHDQNSKFLSYKQSIMDNIEAQRLPLDESVKWLKDYGSKELTTQTVLNILSKLYHQKSMSQAIKESMIYKLNENTE